MLDYNGYCVVYPNWKKMLFSFVGMVAIDCYTFGFELLSPNACQF